MFIKKNYFLLKKKISECRQLALPYSTVSAWTKLWRRPARHFQFYLGLIALLLGCAPTSSSSGCNCFIFSFPAEQRPPSNLLGIVSTQCAHTAGIHSDFVRGREAESHHVQHPYYFLLCITFCVLARAQLSHWVLQRPLLSFRLSYYHTSTCHIKSLIFRPLATRLQSSASQTLVNVGTTWRTC